MPLYRTAAGVVFFVHIPKTGGTSIEKTLKRAGAAEALKMGKRFGYSKATLQHMHAEIYEQAVGTDFADYSFTIIRNPYDRFASEYKMKVLGNGLDDSVDDWATQNFARFKEFDYTRDNHIRPQVAFMSNRLEVFRFEDGLEAALAAACKHLDLDVPEVRHEKRGNRGVLEATSETLERINAFYRDDFAEFDYGALDYGNSFSLVQ